MGRLDVLTAARALEEGGAPAASQLDCAVSLAQSHAWSLQLAGSVGDEEVSAALPLVFDTANAFAPGGVASSFRWTHGDYGLRGTAWFAATPSEVRHDVIVRLRIEDDAGHALDDTANLIGGVARAPGTDDAWGLGNLEVDLYDFAGAVPVGDDGRFVSVPLDRAPQARLTLTLASRIVVDHSTAPSSLAR